jgi:hypothetical protein
MIVKDIDEMRRFLPTINMKGSPAIFDDALMSAQQDLSQNILGRDLEERIDARNKDDSKLLRMCQRIISISAFLSSLHEMDVVLTDAGFAVINSEDFAPASKERVANLKASLQAKLDAELDRLVTYLMESGTCDDWRGTEQFARLSDGLFLTFSDFKDLAIYNAVTMSLYPKSWSDFLRLNASLNVALMTDAAKYISREYAETLIEKLRDMEVLLPEETAALKLIKISIAAFAMGDKATGNDQAIKAANYMKAHIDSFPVFKGSEAYSNLKGHEHKDGPIFSMF